MGLALLLSLYDSCPLTPALTQPRPQHSPKVSSIWHFTWWIIHRVGSSVRREMRKSVGEILHCAPWGWLERLKPRSASAWSLSRRQGHFSEHLLAFLCLFQREEWCIIAHTSGLSAPYCTAPPELPGRYLSIKIYCVCCGVRGEGSMCVCVISDCAFFFFLQRRLFQLALEDSVAA